LTTPHKVRPASFLSTALPLNVKLELRAIMALWPVRYIRLLAVVVNGLMIRSTPICGRHYLIDLVAGGLVAWGGIAAAKWLNARWLAQKRKWRTGAICGGARNSDVAAPPAPPRWPLSTGHTL